MNFGFTEEQELLRAEVRKFLDQNCPLEEVRKIAATPEGVAKPLFERMAELGWVGLTLPDRHGGIGLGWVDLVVVLEETGRTLFPSPLIATRARRHRDRARRERGSTEALAAADRHGPDHRDARAARGERSARPRRHRPRRASATAHSSSCAARSSS